MLQITAEVLDIMLAHCQHDYPLEACGFLGGVDGTIIIVSMVENLLQSPVAYEMTPQQQLEAMLNIEENGYELLAAYHSHPHGPSRPSMTDMAQAYYPDLPMVIVSLQARSAPSVRAFLLAQDKFQDVKLSVV